MTFFVVTLTVVACIAAYYAATTPRRTLRLLQRSAASAARTERLTALYGDLVRLTEHSRVLLEQAFARQGHGLAQEEIDLLIQIRSLCESRLPGLGEESPVLARYYKNHVAILTYVLGESDPSAGATERMKNSLEEIHRFQAVQHSDDALARLERRLATGQGR